MTSSRDVLRLHVDLRDRLANPGDMLGRYVAEFGASQIGDPSVGRTMAETAGRHVAHGRSYHVEPHMVDLVLRRAEDPEHFRGIEPFGQFEPTFSMGFCVMGKPMETYEVSNRKQKTVAITWGPAQAVFDNVGEPGRANPTPRNGRLIIMWTNATLAPDEVHEDSMAGRARGMDKALAEEIADAKSYSRLMEQVGGWAPAVVDFIPLDAKLGPATIEVPYEKRQLAVIQGWEWRREGTMNYARILAALWELMGETLTSVSVEQPQDRATARFAKRNKIDTGVTTIKLRREAAPVINPGSGTPLAFRIPVNGHKRTYHRGTENEFSIWIRDHQRGPKNAPLKVNQKVYNLAK